MKYAAIVLLDVTGVVLIGAQQPLGWLALGAGVLALAAANRQMRKDVVLIFGSLAILAITPITTDVSLGHILEMGGLLVLAVAMPYVVSRFVYKDHAVRFQLHHGRNWYKREIAYVVFTAVVSYLLLPPVLRESGIYANWTVEAGVGNLGRLFIGTNGLGIWDELFFICTVLGLLRRHMRFWLANAVQAVLFTSFLYELGFRSWVFAVIFGFALLQGYIFKKTESLFYVITIHLVTDLFLYLALINAHHPNWMPIFIT